MQREDSEQDITLKHCTRKRTDGSCNALSLRLKL